jgi:hypothetical protein
MGKPPLKVEFPVVYGREVEIPFAGANIFVIGRSYRGRRFSLAQNKGVNQSNTGNPFALKAMLLHVHNILYDSIETISQVKKITL